MVSIPHVLSGISIILLVIYGIDVLVGGGGAGEGFLPFDAMTRGIGFGFPPIILSFVAFFMSKNPPFKGLGIMLIITGILIGPLVFGLIERYQHFLHKYVLVLPFPILYLAFYPQQLSFYLISY